LRERNEVFLSLDRTRIVAYCRKHGIHIPSDEAVFWAGVHKVRLQVATFSPEVKDESRRWLREHGFKETMW
jgi:hypothetical protein